MSLLMKALEKAAKDREETDAERTTHAAPDTGTVTPSAGKAKTDLSLEPIAQQPATTPAAMRNSAAPPRKPANAAPGTSTTQSAQAAALMRAGEREARGGSIGA